MKINCDISRNRTFHPPATHRHYRIGLICLRSNNIAPHKNNRVDCECKGIPCKKMNNIWNVIMSVEMWEELFCKSKTKQRYQNATAFSIQRYKYLKWNIIRTDNGALALPFLFFLEITSLRLFFFFLIYCCGLCLCLAAATCNSLPHSGKLIL